MCAFKHMFKINCSNWTPMAYMAIKNNNNDDDEQRQKKEKKLAHIHTHDASGSN